MRVGLRPPLLPIATIAFYAIAPVALPGQEPPAPPSPAAPAAPATPASPAAPAMRRAFEWIQEVYECEGGAKVRVYLHNETVKVVYKDRVYLMKQTRSADGSRYSDGKVVWWSKGYGGFLQADTPDGNGEMIVKGCEQEKPPLSPEAKQGIVSGTVSYLMRITLPPSAIIEVTLQEGSNWRDPAKGIAKQEITLGDRQVPVPYELKFDPAKIDTRHAYFVSALILVDGELWFSGQALVLAGGMLTHPANVIVQPKTWTIAPAKP